MKQRVKGQPRRVTDLDIAKLRAWRPFKELCDELGINRSWAYHLRGGYQHKKPEPK
jgi:hypothetical protein